MKAIDLYNRLEKDFRLAICEDYWNEMDFNEYITQNFKDRFMGLVTDNADVVNYVYTAVFPSARVIEKIIADDQRNALLFVHHPMTWDVTKDKVFTDIPKVYLAELKKRKISIYNLHIPLDANGTYGTTYNLAKAVGIEMTEEFCEFGGVKVGIIGKTACRTVHELQKQFETAVGHEVKLYQYGSEEIKGGIAGMVAGGGNAASEYRYLHGKGINVYLTGITRQTEGFAPSIEAHEAAKECCINILAGTHYSTEKFACIKVVEYFEQLGINGEFVPEVPSFADM